MRLAEGDLIILDLDEVLALTLETWFPYMDAQAEGHTHTIVGLSKGMSTTWDFPPSICDTCFTHCLTSPEIVRSYAVRPGAHRVVKRLAQQFRLAVITSRPSEVEETTWEWLRRHHILEYLENVIVTQEPKKPIAEQLGASIIVDDNGPTVLSFRDSSVTAVLFDAPWNQDIPGPRVYSLEEFEHLVRQELLVSA